MILSFLGFFVIFTNVTSDCRYFFPLVPLIILAGIAQLDFAAGKSRILALSILIISIGFSALNISNSKNWYLSQLEPTLYRKSAEELNFKLKGLSPLLVPSITYNKAPVFKFYMKTPPFRLRGDWTSQGLKQSIKKYNIRYIIVSKMLISPSGYKNEDMYGKLPSAYSLENELKKLNIIFGSFNGKEIYTSPNLSIIELGSIDDIPSKEETKMDKHGNVLGSPLYILQDQKPHVQTFDSFKQKQQKRTRQLK
jgi:hypothetical protein